jgi:hypothetical protein
LNRTVTESLTGFRLTQAVVLVALAFMTTGSAWGQMPGGAGGAGGTRGPGTRGGDNSSFGIPRMPMNQESNAPTTVLGGVQYRLEMLEEDLRLRPDQRAAWLVFRERVLGLAEDSQRTARTAMAGDAPAPKRLDRLADIARDRLTAIEDIVEAGKNLYAILTPAQQEVADRRLAAPVIGLAGVEPISAAARAGAPPK